MKIAISNSKCICASRAYVVIAHSSRSVIKSVQSAFHALLQECQCASQRYTSSLQSWNNAIPQRRNIPHNAHAVAAASMSRRRTLHCDVNDDDQRSSSPGTARASDRPPASCTQIYRTALLYRPRVSRDNSSPSLAIRTQAKANPYHRVHCVITRYRVLLQTITVLSCKRLDIVISVSPELIICLLMGCVLSTFNKATTTTMVCQNARSHQQMQLTQNTFIPALTSLLCGEDCSD